MADRMGVEERIAHFLRVSEDAGATQAERDVALREAERLIAKHAVDRLGLDLDGERRPRPEPIETGVLDVDGGRGTVSLDVVLGLSKVARSLGLYPYYSDRRTWPRTAEPEVRPHVRLSFTGFRSDVALAEPLLRSLQVQAVLAMRSWWRGDPDHRGVVQWDAHLAKCAFVQSFGAGAAERLQTGREEAAEQTGKALVLVSREAEVTSWVQEHVVLRSARDRRSFSGYGRAQGYSAGLRSHGAGAAALPT